MMFGFPVQVTVVRGAAPLVRHGRRRAFDDATLMLAEEVAGIELGV